MKTQSTHSHGHRSVRGILAGCAALALLLMLTGCNAATLFGRPQTYTDLADQVVDAMSRERPDVLQSLTITNEDKRRLGEDAEGDQQAVYAPAATAVGDSYSQVRKDGENDGILWAEAQMTSAVAEGAHNKFKEKVDIRVNLDSRGNHFQLLIKNAQLVDNGDVVLTDRIKWLGAR